MSWKNLLTALALSFSINASALPLAPIETSWVVKTAPNKVEINDLTLAVNVQMLELYAGKLEIGYDDSILHDVDLDTVTLMTLGLTLDFNLYDQNLSSSVKLEVPFGIDLSFSSSKLFGKTIDDKGKIKRGEMEADYSIDGKLTYFGFGLRLAPRVFYKNGPFRIGGTISTTGGVSYIDSENTYTANIVGKEMREALQAVEINPDMGGSVDIFGFGGFVQITTGPVIGIYDLICSYSLGARYDAFSFNGVESSNSVLMGLGTKKYGVKYSESTLIHKFSCGYKF